MTNNNHPNRTRGPYRAEVGGSTWSRGPVADFPTIRECRRWAEEYGTTADYCHIYNRKGSLVAAHHRDTSGDGMRWFRGGI